MKIAFIGAGNMAGAIMRGMCRGSFAGSDIAAFDIDAAKTKALADEWGILAAASAEEAITGADAVVLAVAHRQFRELDLAPLRKPEAVVYDIKGILPRECVDGRL